MASLPPPCPWVHWPARTRNSIYSSWRHSVKLDKDLLLFSVLGVSAEELVLPRNVRCALSHLHCNGHSPLFNIVLPSYYSLWTPHTRFSTYPDCLSCVQLIALSKEIFLALLYRFLTSGHDRGAPPTCWISIEFLHFPILRKGLGSYHHYYYCNSSFPKDISSQQLLKYTNTTSMCNLITIIIQPNYYFHHFLKIIKTPHYPEQCASLNQT